MNDLQKQERQIRDIQAPDYETIRRKAYFIWFELSEKRIVKSLLQKHSGGWLLDAACATGRLTKYFQKFYPKLVSVDFSFSSLKVAAQKNPGAYYLQADLSALPFKPVFASIVCLDALHCIPTGKRQKAVKACSEVLVPGGEIMATIWNEESFSRIFELPLEGKFKSGIYYQSMKEDQIQQLFTETGFKDIDIYGLGYFIYLVRSIRFTSTLYRILGWITILLEQLLTRVSPPGIKNKAMYFIVKANKVSEKDEK